VALRLQLVVQARSYFPHIYFAMAAVTVAAFLYVIPDDYRAWLLPAFMLGEPALLGLTLVAGLRYLEKNERTLNALVVTPLRDAEYIIATVLSSVVVSCVAGAGIQAGVIGLDVRVLLVIPPLFLVSSIVGLVGLALSTSAEEFPQFLMTRMIPFSALLQAPVLAYFDVVPRALFVWMPTDAALFAFAMLAEGPFSTGLYTLYVGVLAVFCGAAFVWATHAFRVGVRQRMETA
jgi:fluoroquinolone transport system permease protein